MTLEKLEAIKKEALGALDQAQSEQDLGTWETTYLGRKGEFSALLRSVKELAPEERKTVGAAGNTIKHELIVAGAAARTRLVSQTLSTEHIDVTLPGGGVRAGHLHPITVIEEEIEDIFTGMGFSITDGPEVESEKYNYDVLNFPPDHPARDMQDAFWLTDRWGKKRFLPRTHTSPVQVRYMEQHKPPFQIIIPGRVFRNEATDASHEHTFHHFECLVVGDDISVAHFKSVAETFFSAFFQRQTKIRLRPSFFPFTEPSFEFDIHCLLCHGSGCPVCKGSGWLEIGGAGMVHQNVFVAAGYPRDRYQGFAWGFGLTRLAMMKYTITDIRIFMSGDLRFIRQF